jgi:hypothetical protein
VAVEGRLVVSAIADFLSGSVCQDEPTGLGAVVLAADGDYYIRPKTTTTIRHWKRARGETGHTRYSWDELPHPVVVLSAGVEVIP